MNRTTILLGILFVINMTVTLDLRADNTLNIGEMNQVEGSELPIVLNCSEALSCFTARLRYPENMKINPDDIRIDPVRFPWKKRGLLISVDDIMHTITITAVDLLGKNAMILPGTGNIFSITNPDLQKLNTNSEFKITQAEAFDLKGDPVKLVW